MLAAGGRNRGWHGGRRCSSAEWLSSTMEKSLLMERLRRAAWWTTLRPSAATMPRIPPKFLPISCTQRRGSDFDSSTCSAMSCFSGLEHDRLRTTDSRTTVGSFPPYRAAAAESQEEQLKANSAANSANSYCK
jgi:hypothetical protein